MDTSFAVLEGVSTLASGREAAPDVARYLQSPQLADLAILLHDQAVKTIYFGLLLLHFGFSL